MSIKTIFKFFIENNHVIQGLESFYNDTDTSIISNSGNHVIHNKEKMKVIKTALDNYYESMPVKKDGANLNQDKNVDFSSNEIVVEFK